MKLTTKQLKQIIKEELNELIFQFDQKPRKEPTPSGISKLAKQNKWDELGQLPSQLDFSYENPDSW
jgi:hypothetical protein